MCQSQLVFQSQSPEHCGSSYLSSVRLLGKRAEYLTMPLPFATNASAAARVEAVPCHLQLLLHKPCESPNEQMLLMAML